MQKTVKATKVAKKANKSAKGKKAVSTKPALKLDPAQIKKAKQLIGKLQVNPVNGSVGVIKQIFALYGGGFTQKEIIAYGFNKSTVYRQVRELVKVKNLHKGKQITAKGAAALTSKSM